MVLPFQWIGVTSLSKTVLRALKSRTATSHLCRVVICPQPFACCSVPLCFPDHDIDAPTSVASFGGLFSIGRHSNSPRHGGDPLAAGPASTFTDTVEAFTPAAANQGRSIMKGFAYCRARRSAAFPFSRLRRWARPRALAWQP